MAADSNPGDRSPVLFPDDPLESIARAVASPLGSPRFDTSFSDQLKTPRKRLWAISDLHLSYRGNREAWEELVPHPGDWLIICGDVGETVEHLQLAFAKAKQCFEEVFWAPGNHELYTLASKKDGARGVAKYQECVAVARQHHVWTPEDPYQLWDGGGSNDDHPSNGADPSSPSTNNLCLIAPIFTLYDYTFRPPEIPTKDAALAWASEVGIVATDEHLLHPDPFPSREAWCSHLLAEESSKLAAASATGLPLVIAGHWPLRYSLVNLLNVPRFSIWCGSTQTEDWHLLYNARVVVSGHLHVRRTDWVDGVRFEEVSLGYPKQWAQCRERGLDVNDMLREILPGPRPPGKGVEVPTQYRRYG